MTVLPGLQPERISLGRLPKEVKQRIISYLPLTDKVSLSKVNTSWHDIIEERIWSRVDLSTSQWIALQRQPNLGPRAPRKWKKLVDAIQSSPRRAGSLRHLSGPSHPAAIDHITKVISLSDQSLESLRQTVPSDYHIDRNFLNAFRGVQKPLVLKYLDAQCFWSWEDQIFQVIKWTPRLQQLVLHMEPDREEHQHRHPVRARPDRDGVRLDHLRCINMEADEWVEGLIWLLGMTKCVENISVKTVSMDLGGYDEQFEDLFVILKTGTLQWLTVTGPGGGEIWRRSLTMDGAAFLPKLESLAVETQWGPAGVPSHPSIRYLGLFSNPYTPPVCFSGTLPTSSTTGLLAPWLIEGLERLPEMIHLFPLDVLDWECTDGRWWEDHSGGFAFQTFEHKKRVLYHCRVEYDHVTARLLGRHDLSYIDDQLFWEDEQQSTQTRRSTSGTEDENEGAPQMGTWLDLTSYRGLPLPRALLDYIYTFNGLSCDWTTGRRRVSLSLQTWDILDEWAHLARLELVTTSRAGWRTDDRIDRTRFGFGHTCPPQIRKRLLSFVDIPTAHNLSRLNKSWREIAETRLWRNITLSRSGGKSESRLADRASVVERRWTRCHQALLARLSRRSLVRTITFPPDHTPEIEMCSVLRRIAPYVEEMRNAVEKGGPSIKNPGGGLIAVELLSRIGCFPKLKVLDVILDDWWEHTLIKALSETPNLEELIMTAMECSDLPDPIPHNTTLKLNHLRSVRINADRWFPGAEVLMKHIPNLTDLIIFGGNGGFRPKVTANSLRYMCQTKTVKRLALDGDRAKAFAHAQREIGADQFFPKLTDLAVQNEGLSFLVHPTVTRYSILLDSSYIPNSPDMTYTARMPAMFIQCLEGCPAVTSICLISDYKKGEFDWGEGRPTYLVRSYTTGSRTMYHLRLVEIQGQEAAHYDMTWYNGRPVSWRLLEQMYECAGMTKDWKDGQRGMSLSLEAWRVLDEQYGDAIDERDK